MIRLWIIFIIFFSSCKNKFEKDKEHYFNRFKITLNYKIEQNDIIQVFYASKTADNYSEKKSIIKEAKKDSIYKQILFVLPKGVIPAKIRIDLGENQKVNKISIKEVKISRNNKQFVIDSTMIKYFFSPNKYLKYNTHNNIFTTKIISEKTDPYLLSTPLLNKKLEILF